MKKLILSISFINFLFTLSTAQTGSDNALNFDGVNDYVNLNTLQTDLYNSANSFTIEFWMKADTADQTSNPALFAINLPTTENRLLITIGSASTGNQGKLIVGDEIAGSGPNYISSMVVADGICHHIAYSFDGTYGKTYIDGVLVDTDTPSITLSPQDRYSLGQEWDNSLTSQFYNGMLDDVRIWGIVRSDTDIAANKDQELSGNETGLIAYYDFNEGIAAGNNTGTNLLTDRTGNTLDGSLIDFGLNGNTSNWVNDSCSAPLIGSDNALNFDGVNDYVNLDAIQTDFYNNTSNFTIEFWMNANYQDQTSAGTMMFAINNPPVTENRMLISLGGTANPGQLVILDELTNGPEYISNNIIIGDGNCHHIAYSYDGTYGKVYIDGVLVNTHNASYHVTLQDRYSLGQEWDGGPVTSQFYNGMLDDVRIWGVVRSDADIAANKDHELTGSEAGLIAYYDFNEGVAGGNNTGINTLTDRTGNLLDGNLIDFSLNGYTSNWVYASCGADAPNSGVDTVVACDSYTWIDGNTYTVSSDSNQTVIVGGSADGSDSLVTLYLTINNSYSVTDVESACDSYTWIDGNTYTSSNNTATYLLTTINGCDSLVTLNLTINNSTTGTDVITACDSYTWIDGNTYTSSNNTATYLLTTINGCDSLVTLDLTINYPTSGTDVITACNSYTWIDGNTYTSSNNTATYTILGGAANGCDSTVYLDLTIESINTNIIVTDSSLIAVMTGVQYQWIDCNNGDSIIPGETNQSFIPQNGGYYAVIITNNCSDTSECVSMSGTGIEGNGLPFNIEIYPNPSNGVFTLNSDNINVLKYSISNIYGQYIEKTGTIVNGQNTIDASKLSSGTYLIRIESNNGIIVKKIVITH